MTASRSPWTWIALLYATFGMLVAADLVLAILSASYRDQFGEVGGPGGAALRFLPDCALLAFYGMFLHRATVRRQRPVYWVVGHSILYLLISVLLALPWVGLVAAPFSPVAVLYFAALSLAVHAYPAILTLAALFASVNVWCLLAAVRRGEA